MAKEKVIGVSMRISCSKSSNELRDSISKDWSNFLQITFPDNKWIYIPNIGKNDVISYCERVGINSLILTGGDDLGKFEIRDETEFELLNWAERTKIPLIGICRGMQLMGVREGVKLKKSFGHVNKKHKVDGIISQDVLCFHNYALDKSPKNYKVTSLSSDGEIESIKHKYLNWEGFMWHPERVKIFNSNDIKRFRELLK